jgi:hypothetical protein
MALSEEELGLARLRAKAKLRLRQQQAAPVSAVPTTTPAPKEQDALSYAGDLAQTFTGGTLAGWGDEAVGGARAIGDLVFGDVSAFGDEEGNQSFPQAYKMYRDDARRRKEEFAQANPKTAIAAELAGGIASPINRVAPGFGSGMLPKSLDLTTKAGRTALQRARIGASAARGTVEGAVAGLGQGEGSLEEQLGSAGQGALFGGVTSGAMTGALGGFGNTLAKERITRQLGYGDNFVPAHIADPEGNVGSFYRKYIGNAIGGRGPLGKQESNYLRQNPKITSLVKDGESLFPETVGTRHAVSRLKEEISDETDIAKSLLSRQSSAMGEKIADTKSAIGAQRAAQREAVDQAASQQMRERTLPSTMPPELKNEIMSSDYDQAEKLLSKWWDNNAFQMVKGRGFEWDNGLRKELKSLSEEDPAFALTLGNVASNVDGMVDKLVAQGKKRQDLVPQDYINELATDENLFINGDALMALRNSFAMPANMGGPNFKGKLKREVVDKFDDMIRRQLGDDAKFFDDEISRWGTKQAFSKAANVARKKGQSNVKPQQIGSALRPSKHSAPAFQILRQAEEAKSAIPSKVTKSDVGGLIKTRKAIENKKVRIGQRERAATRRVDRETAGMLSAPPSSWSQIASTMILGAPLSFGVGALPAGIAAASTLSRPAVQRLIAGQTNKQKQLAEALRKGALSPVTRVTSRAAALANTNKDEEQ